MANFNEDQLIERWNWLTEDIEDYNRKKVTSMVLENSYKNMVDEGQLNEGWVEALNEGNDEALNEAPVTTGAAGNNLIPKVLFPVIRRVFPQLIANELVSVQPISQRTGVIYYISYQFSDEKGNVKKGQEYSGTVISKTNYDAVNQTLPGFDAYYSADKLGPFTATVAANAAAATTVSVGSKVTSFLGTSTSEFTLKRAEVYNTATGRAYATVLKTMATGPATFTGTENVVYLADVGSIVLKDGGPWENATDTNLKIYLVYSQEGSKFIPEMEFQIGSTTVETDQRKMKVRWTKEAEQDMKAYHAIDVESELVKVASMEMNYEIDRELINFIGDKVQTELSFSHTWNADAQTSGNNTQGNYLDRHRALSQKIYMAGAKIAQYNRQGPASWAVVSPEVGAVLSMLPNFKGEISGGTFNVFNAGMLGNGLKVYIDPNKVGNEILLGYKSTETTYGAGVVYAPYTNWMSNVVTNPDNFNSIRGFFSRYAITLVPRGEWYYSKITVDGLLS